MSSPTDPLYSPEGYKVSPIVEWLHAVPHIDITFSSVNSTFDPSSNAYLEALGIIIAVPGFWLILTLLAFLIFFLCRCCDTGFKKKKKLTPLKWALCIFAVLCGGALAVGIFGNDQAHNGIESVRVSTENIQNILTTLKNQTLVIENTLKDNIKRELEILDDKFNKPLANVTIHNILKQSVKDMEGNVSLGVEKMKEINEHLNKFRLPAIPVYIGQVEIIRWPVTIAVLCVLVLICLILFWGVLRHSRCLLILFSVLGLLSVVICWVLVSLYIGISVAGSDFCTDPKPLIYEQADGVIETSILNYYINCGKEADPFEDAKREGRQAIESVERTLVIVSKVALAVFTDKSIEEELNLLTQKVNETERIINSMQALIDCQILHKEYIAGMDAACTNVIEGTGFMLVSAVGAGLLFTILIYLSSHTWIHIRKKRQNDHVDEEDPFLPPASGDGAGVVLGGGGGANNATRRNRDTNGRSGSREDPTFLQGRYTPPPAYEQLSGRNNLQAGIGYYPPYKP